MKMLFTDYTSYCRLRPEDEPWLRERGIEVLRCPDGEPYPGDPSQIEAVACCKLFSHTPIQAFTSLRYIQGYTAGFEHLPMDYIQDHGIQFHNARGVYSVPIAEFAIGGLLTLYKDLRTFERRQGERVWKQRAYLRELWGKSVLIVGAGSIGAAFASRLKAFGCAVTGLARTAGHREHFDRVLGMEALDDCLPQADVVILCLPRNDDTFHIMDEARLARMKEGAVLVNICRGAVADEAALIRALESGRLSGAVLDVFETEPLPESSPLWAMENVIVTPHSSFAAENNAQRLWEIMRDNLAASGLLEKEI